jgi:hypothetical protein
MPAVSIPLSIYAPVKPLGGEFGRAADLLNGVASIFTLVALDPSVDINFVRGQLHGNGVQKAMIIYVAAPTPAFDAASVGSEDESSASCVPVLRVPTSQLDVVKQVLGEVEAAQSRTEFDTHLARSHSQTLAHAA